MRFDKNSNLARRMRADALWTFFCCLILPTLSFFETSLLMFIDSNKVTLQLMIFGWISTIGLIAALPILSISIVSPIISRAAASAFGIFSFIALKLLYLPFFYNKSIVTLTFLVFLLWVCLLAIVIRSKDKIIGVTLSLALTLSAVFVVTPLLTRFSELSLALEKDAETSYQSPLHSGAEPINDELATVALGVTFKDKPDVTILLYDSFIPPEVAREFFGSPAAYESTLNKFFARPSGLTLQMAVPSHPAIRDSLWLSSQRTPDKEYGYFTGRKNSPLLAIFRSQGYQIVTGFTIPGYFGDAGPYVDRFISSASRGRLQDSQLCIDSSEQFLSVVRGFGACQLLGGFHSFPKIQELLESLRLNKKVRHWATDPATGIPRTPSSNWNDDVLTLIRDVKHDSRPQLTFLYTYSPIGHTSWDYDHGDLQARATYTNHFIKESYRLDQILSDLAKLVQDENHLLLVAGDHGTYISRGSTDNRFRLVDQHMVAIGLLRSNNECAQHFHTNGFAGLKEEFHSFSSVLREILGCLAHRPIPLKEHRDPSELTSISGRPLDELFPLDDL